MAIYQLDFILVGSRCSFYQLPFESVEAQHSFLWSIRLFMNVFAFFYLTTLRRFEIFSFELRKCLLYFFHNIFLQRGIYFGTHFQIPAFLEMYEEVILTLCEYLFIHNFT